MDHSIVWFFRTGKNICSSIAILDVILKPMLKKSLSIPSRACEYFFPYFSLVLLLKSATLAF